VLEIVLVLLYFK